MAGPGGGGKSGGFSRGPSGGGRGGGFSRGSHSGGFGGGHHHHGHYGHHHHHHHHRYFGMPFFFGYRRPYMGYGYGGFYGGFIGLMMLPIIILIVAISLIFSVFGSLGSSISNVVSGGEISYNEQKFQDYANQQYEKEFASYVNRENNILIVLLINEERNDFTTISWLGDNINGKINEQFGGQPGSEFYEKMMSGIGQYYEYSLDNDLSNIVDALTEKIEDLNLESSFKQEPTTPSDVKSHVTNQSTLSITEETVNSSLENFTEQTDIPIVILIEDIDDVLDRKINGADILTIVVAAALIALAVYLLVKAFKNRKPLVNEPPSGSEQKQNRENKFNNDKNDKNNSTYW